jgi:hypothetical protein
MKGGASFYNKIVILVALCAVVFFLVLSYGMIQLEKSTWESAIPNTCPDYWVETSKNTCSDIRGLSTSSPCKNEESATPFSRDMTQYDTKLKKNGFAKSCGVGWEGITYGTMLPEGHDLYEAA